jgi:GAF domain-containing protein
MIITFQDQIVIGPAEWQHIVGHMPGVSLHFNHRQVGHCWQEQGDVMDADLEMQLSTCMQLAPEYGVPAIADMFLIWQCLKKIQSEYTDIIDWAGIYFKESYLYNIESNYLILGPFIGEKTDHWKISIDRGLCGMAIRENRTVNAPDVRAEVGHIACSLKTRSELVIPIYSASGEAVAELDLDSNKLNAFSKTIEDKIKKSLQVWQLPAKTYR